MTQVIKKALIGLEDLLIGESTVTQTRGTTSVPITKIDTDWIFTSLAQIKGLDVARIKHVIYVDSNGERFPFDYSAVSALTGNDDDVLLPDSGTGRWLLRRENNQQTQTTATGTGGASTTSHEGIEAGFILNTTFSDDSQTAGTGQAYEYTGTTDATKAGDWPNADGYYYDADGKQFQIADTANLPTGINGQTGTSYTLVRNDAYISGGKSAVRITNAASIVCTVPANADVQLPIGSVVNVIQGGAGTITLTGASGVTINGDNISRGQYHALSIVKIAANEWDAVGGTGAGITTPVNITLTDHTLTAVGVTVGVLLNSDGSLTTLEGTGTEIVAEWALPRVSQIGSIYEAKMDYVSGDYTNGGDLLGTWLSLSDLKAWGVQELGSTLNFVGTLSIRDVATGTVQDTCTIDLTSSI